MLVLSIVILDQKITVHTIKIQKYFACKQPFPIGDNNIVFSLASQLQKKSPETSRFQGFIMAPPVGLEPTT